VKSVCTFALLLTLIVPCQAETGFQEVDMDSTADQATIVELQQTGSATEGSSDIALFIGRFHPFLIHLPIGFLLFAFLLECAGMFKRFEPLKPAVPFALLMRGLKVCKRRCRNCM